MKRKRSVTLFAVAGMTLVCSLYAGLNQAGFRILMDKAVIKEFKDLNATTYIWEAYRNGAKAKWLPGEDYLTLLAEPLENARLRLNIARPTNYQRIPKDLRDALGADLQMAA